MSQFSIPPPSKMDMTGDLVSNWEFFRNSWKNYATGTLSTYAEIFPWQLMKDKTPMLSLRSSVKISYWSEIRSTNATCLTLVPRKPMKASINSWQRFANLPLHVSSVRLRTKCSVIVSGLQDHGHHKHLRESTLTLQKAIDICWTNKMAASQRHKLEQSGAIHFALEEKKRPRKNPRRSSCPTRPCKYCCDTHAVGNCHAYGKTCTKCNKENHLAKVCQSTSR